MTFELNRYRKFKCLQGGSLAILLRRDGSVMMAEHKTNLDFDSVS